jgi:uncharacterized protein YjiS (DUF1127 family)
MAATSYMTSGSGSALSGPLAIFEAIKSRIVKYRLYHRTLAELQSLSTRELTDLGLNRSMLNRVAYQAVYDKV